MILQNRYSVIITAVYLLSIAAFSEASVAQAQSVLNPENHPSSPSMPSAFDDKLIPLDSTVSWTERFNGDETFNDEQMLSQGNNMSNTTTRGSNKKMKSGMQMDAQGIIKSVRQDQGKIKIEHGPIDKYGMPAMTMVFKVDDPTMLEGLVKDQDISFDIDNSSGGFVITYVMMTADMTMNISDSQKVGMMKTAMDASGVVKSIRVSQGKIKIEHDPIDKYGMPGMTMMFKVQDPALLDGLEKGAQVEFDIDNTSGGFEITNIKTVNE